ncbi:MAG: AmmeMemoRadiSam system radical SAM enzyme [Candidatus Heimdallarchaeota archaeon]
MKEAMFYEPLDEQRVHCYLCHHHCSIRNCNRGRCLVRENQAGVLYSLVYGKIIAHHIDPIEKKPLFHFYPASLAYSIATIGCNFSCSFCQNFHISQAPQEKQAILGEEISPKEIVQEAKQYNCTSIAYTYTEPTIFYEFAYDVAKLAHKEGIKNVFITNGYMTEEALRTISPYLDAANIDLKGFTEEFYRKMCGARLQPVLDTIRLHKELGIWIEVTTLIIPALNDSDDQLRGIAEFLRDLGEEIPWHITQFYPTYKLTDKPRTPVATLRRARKIGLEVGLRYVYEGNIPRTKGEHTYCYHCQALLIERDGFRIGKNVLNDSRCPNCNSEIDGIGLKESINIS